MSVGRFSSMTFTSTPVAQTIMPIMRYGAAADENASQSARIIDIQCRPVRLERLVPNCLEGEAFRPGVTRRAVRPIRIPSDCVTVVLSTHQTISAGTRNSPTTHGGKLGGEAVGPRRVA